MSRWSHALRKLLLLPDTRSLLIGLLLALFIGLLELGFSFARPCVQSSRLYSEECGNSVLLLLGAYIFKSSILIGLGIGATRERVGCAMSTQFGLDKAKAAVNSRAASMGWAPASSKSVFEGVVKVINHDYESRRTHDLQKRSWSALKALLVPKVTCHLSFGPTGNRKESNSFHCRTPADRGPGSCVVRARGSGSYGEP